MSLRPFHAAFLAAALVAALGVLAAVSVHDEDAAATIVRRVPRRRPLDDPVVPS